MIFKDQTEALLDSKCEINVMSQAFTSQPSLKVQKTNIGAYKIEDTTLKIYGIVVLTFFVLNKDARERFFEESFFWADVKPDIMLTMLFLIMSNANFYFQARDL